jgi:hypothetical protein
VSHVLVVTRTTFSDSFPSKTDYEDEAICTICSEVYILIQIMVRILNNAEM